MAKRFSALAANHNLAIYIATGVIVAVFMWYLSGLLLVPALRFPYP